MKLNAESRPNIFRIAKGKFNLLINHNLVFLVVIPGTSSIIFPCLHNTQPYGFHNGTISNIIANSLSDEPSQIVLRFLNSRNAINCPALNLIYGIRLEWNDESDTHNLRFLLNHSNLSESFLNALKDIYSSISLSSDTFHVIPMLLKKGIDNKLSTGLDYSDVWKFIKKNDILLSDVNEMSVVAKNPTTNNVTSNNSSRSNSSTARNLSNHSAASSTRSIFDRLMPRENTLSATEELNLSMGFRRVTDRNITARRLIKPKMKSVVTKISNK
jgi:hypothetical protein